MGMLKVGRLSLICSNIPLSFWSQLRMAINTDFSKALNRVRHCLLLYQVSNDVDPARCQLLRSYFSGTIQRIRMEDCVSREILITSGVTQSAIWGHSDSSGL
jgi:hypothetical protein